MNDNLIHLAIWAVVIVGLFIYLWWQGQIKRLSIYWQETMSELHKCSWPSWVELRGSTLLVISMVAFLGLFVFVVDEILDTLFIR